MEEFTKLLMAIVRGLLPQGVALMVIVSAHQSLEALDPTLPTTGTMPERQRARDQERGHGDPDRRSPAANA